jgi:rhamnulokinase
MTKVLALDLGASTGRAIVGILENEKLSIDEIYRFSNEGIKINESLYWDVLKLFKDIKKSISIYANKYGMTLDSLGIDTWGVDFVLLDSGDELLGPIHHYRDSRTEGMLEELFHIIPKEEIFNETGIQFMSLNSIVQLYSMIYHSSPRLSIAKTFLMLPDYFNFLLSGVKCCEYSDVTTTQLYNPIKRNWAYNLIKKLNLNPELFPKIIQPGTILGNVRDYIVKEVGLDKSTKVIAPPTHDTGSAVAAVPVDMGEYKPGQWAYLSSGTWSLLGVEISEPLINEKVLEYNFTNEGGINSTIRFLKNISGLWLIQECKKEWDINGYELSWERIEKEAKESQPFQHFFQPDQPLFLNPPSMTEAIKKSCELQNQTPPRTIGQISRAIFENLVFRYKQIVDQLEELIVDKLSILHIIGGGSRNELLNQFTANLLRIPVKAGPSEATAIGNILVQCMALGDINSLHNLRQIVRNSFEIKEYSPVDCKEWSEAYKTYLTYLK